MEVPELNDRCGLYSGYRKRHTVHSQLQYIGNPVMRSQFPDFQDLLLIMI